MEIKTEKWMVSGAAELPDTKVDLYCLIREPVIELHILVINEPTKMEMEFVVDLGMNQLKNMVPADEALDYLIKQKGGKEDFAAFAVMRLIRLIHLHIRKMRTTYEVFVEISLLSRVPNIRSAPYFEQNLDALSKLFDLRRYN